MKKKLLSAVAAVCACAALMTAFTACNNQQQNIPRGNIGEVTLEENDVFAIIHVRDYGDITLKLFPELAPEAVEQFMTLALRGYYDGRNFHRVIEDFLIQGGSFTGNGYDGEVAPEEYINVEVSDYALHFYGALCFAKNSSGNYCQFYIVNNNEPQDIDKIAADIRSQLDDADIAGRMLEEDKAYYENYYNELMAIPDDVKEKYLEVGGNFQLDGEHTVFGQTIDGFEVLEAISSVEVVSGNIADDREGTASKPLDDIIIDSIDIIKIAVKNEETASTSKVTRVTTTPPVMAETEDTTVTEASEESSGDAAVTAGSEETSPSDEEITSADEGTTNPADEEATAAEEGTTPADEETEQTEDTAEAVSDDMTEDLFGEETADEV